jgi:pimeloyl-ACP methyl ester carboxylesterase
MPSSTPSFPGFEERVDFVNREAGVTLAGMLVLPPGKGPFPAALYMGGSGPGNVNASLVSFAETLAQRGIAILIYDKRGCGQSTGDFKASHYPEFQQDAVCAFEFLKGQPPINPNQVGLIGHSEGGMIAEMIAAEHPDVSFVVLMAAPGMRGDRLRALQGVQESKAYGVDGKVLQSVQEIMAEALPMLETEKDPLAARGKLHEILEKGYRGLDKKEKGQLEEVLEGDNATIEARAITPWARQFLLWDPIPYLKKIQCPVLALNGDRDIAVVYPQNLDAIGQALKEGGNRDYTLKMFPNVNHLFRHCVTGTPTENLPYQLSCAPEVLRAMGDWLVKHTK